MPFHRFENLRVHHLNPHLSTGEGPVIEGEYMYFRIVTKKAGTGSTLHYHPNELMAFPLRGKINALVGRERRIVMPGTFVHMPPYARHGFTACEDGDLIYLYIKDRTWTLIGAAQDEALPEQARSATEVARDFAAGKYPGEKKDAAKSQAILDGLDHAAADTTPFEFAFRTALKRETWPSRFGPATARCRTSLAPSTAPKMRRPW